MKSFVKSLFDLFGYKVSKKTSLVNIKKSSIDNIYSYIFKKLINKSDLIILMPASSAIFFANIGLLLPENIFSCLSINF